MATEELLSTQAPWASQAPYLEYGFGEAQNLYNTGGPQWYGPGSTVAPFSQDTTQALQGISNTAQAGTITPQMAQQQIGATLGGDYLGSNPYLDAMYDQATDAMSRQFYNETAPGVAAAFGLSGRSGGNAAFNYAAGDATRNFADALGGMASNLYGNAYNAERNRQVQALGYAPAIAPLAYSDYGQQLNAGALQDQQAQRLLSDDVNKWRFEQERPFDNLSRYMANVAGGSYGSSNTQEFFNDNLAQNFGIGLGIAELLGL